MIKAGAATAVLLALVGQPAAAGLDEGLRAYGNGDYETAAAELTPLAERGDPVAQYTLWLTLRERNLLQGLGWLLKAAAQGHPQAEADLGDVYRLGRGQRKDYAKALDLYRRAADKGEAGGLKGLGDLYRDGLGVPKDPDKARELYQHAIDLGSTAARVAMGDLYRDGVVGEKDDEQALTWYRQAAELGDQAARDRIAEIEAEAAAAEAMAKAKQAGPEGAPAAPGEAGPGGGGAAVVSANTDEAQRLADRLLALFNAYPKAFTLSELHVIDGGGRFKVEVVNLHYGVRDSGYLDVPRLAFTMAPEGDGLYRVSDLEAPSDLAIRDRFGAETGRLLAKVSRFSGLLALDIPLFVDSDIVIRDVRLAVPAKGMVANVGEVALKDVGRLDGQGLWNVDSEYRMSGLRVVGSGGDRIDVAELRYESRITRFNVAAYAELVGEFKRAVGQAGTSDLAQRLAAKLAGGPDYVGDVKGGVTMSGVTVDAPSEGGSLALDEFKLSAEATKVREPRFDFALRISEDGLAIRGAKDAETVRLIKVLPESSRLNLIVTALPKEAFARAFLGYVGTVLGAVVAQPQSAELYAMMAMQRFGEDLLQGMGAAGTVLRLVDTAYRAPIVAINVLAEFKVDGATAYGLVGALTIAVVGLDETIALFQSDPATASPPQTIEALRAASQRTRTAAGTVIDTFVVRVAADGAVTVNGRAYETLLGGQ